MYSLNLNPEEQSLLVELLECSISELHSEIVHTDRQAFKRMLKERKEVLLGMLETLRQATAAQPA